MVKMEVEYDGDLRCTATHKPSGAIVTTDAPVDNHGRGESFSPTDLVATALATCVATIMGIVAEKHEIDLWGMTVEVEKEMVSSPQRRIGKLTIAVKVPRELSEADRTRLERAAESCPVLHSLNPAIETVYSYEYGSLL